jgi:phosphatidylglycerol:prolipoprotein diacylglycerol transferase
VLLFLALKPEAFETNMQFSTSQFIAITTGFAASVAFAVFYKAALTHPESAMALRLPAPAGAPPSALDEDDEDDEDDEEDEEEKAAAAAAAAARKKAAAKKSAARKSAKPVAKSAPKDVEEGEADAAPDSSKEGDPTHVASLSDKKPPAADGEES